MRILVLDVSKPTEEVIVGTRKRAVESDQSRDAGVTLAGFQLLKIAQTDFAFLSQAFLSQSRIDAQPIEIFAKSAKDFDFHS